MTRFSLISSVFLTVFMSIPSYSMQSARTTIPQGMINARCFSSHVTQELHGIAKPLVNGTSPASAIYVFGRPKLGKYAPRLCAQSLVTKDQSKASAINYLMADNDSMIDTQAFFTSFSPKLEKIILFHNSGIITSKDLNIIATVLPSSVKEVDLMNSINIENLIELSTLLTSLERVTVTIQQQEIGTLPALIKAITDNQKFSKTGKVTFRIPWESKETDVLELIDRVNFFVRSNMPKNISPDLFDVEVENFDFYKPYLKAIEEGSDLKESPDIK